MPVTSAALKNRKQHELEAVGFLNDNWRTQVLADRDFMSLSAMKLQSQLLLPLAKKLELKDEELLVKQQQQQQQLIDAKNVDAKNAASR